MANALTQVKTDALADDAVTEAKVANDAIGLAEIKSTTDGQILTFDAAGNPAYVGPGNDGQVLTSTGAGSPPAFEALPASNNYTHPNHSGEVTSTADGAQVIASNVVDEDNLKVSNSPTNGYFLSAQSGNTGGLTWAEAGGGGKLVKVEHMSTTSSASSSDYDTWSDTNLTDTITMAQATNKILVFASLHCFLTDGTTYDYASIRMNNMGTQLVWTPDGGSANNEYVDGADASGHYAFRLNWDDTNWPVKDMGGYLTRSYLIDPDTTTQLTIKLQMRPGKDNMTVHSSYGARSTMTIMEIEYDS